MLKRFIVIILTTLLIAHVMALAAQEHGSHQTAEPNKAADAQAGQEAAHEQQPGLLPDPTDPQTWLSALWVVIIFVVMLAILYPTAWKQVLAGLKAREQRIRTDIAEAEAARAKAEQTLREYTARLAAAEEQIRQMLSRAAADGQQLATSIRMKAQQEAEEIKERANRDIEAARDAAVREIYEKTAELATSVAEKILRRSLNPADQQELVRRSLEQLQEIR